MATSMKHLILPVALALAAACAGSGAKNSSGTSDASATTTGGTTSGTAGTTTAGTTGTTTTGGTTTGTTTGGTTDTKTSQVTITPTTGAASTLPYALLRANAAATDPNKAYTLAISSYNFCGWGAKDNYAGHPDTAQILSIYLQNIDATGKTIAPVVGTYTVATPAPGVAGMYIDPKINAYSAFVKSCTGTYSVYSSGTVEVTAVNGSNITGTLNLTLSDSTKTTGTASGSFVTASCTGTETDGTDGTAAECKW